MATPTGAAGSPQPSSKPSEGGAPVRKIGKYEIQKKIGAGGMGAVYLALDPTLKRSCALKVLPKDKARNPTLVKRFQAEAHAAANLRHENIVSVFDAGEADGYLYMALEYVDGTDVAKLVEQRGPIPLKRSIEIVRQVAKALAHAHEQGIVHRDIKPGNLLVRRDGVVKLADMGLARNLDDNADTSITRAGTTVGTVDYMSPEQARDSKAADVRSDIYSLGCTWYFMLTGHPPFPEGSLTNKLRAHAESPIPDPRGDNPAISEAVFGVIRRMTEKKPGKRYQTPTELFADLDAVSLTSDIVSDTILADLSDEHGGSGGRRRKGSAVVEAAEEYGDSGDKRRKGAAGNGGAATRDDGAPAFKPPPRKDRLGDDSRKPAQSNALLFYAILVVVLVGLVAGIISLVKNFGGSGNGPDQDRMGNPLANRQAAEDAAGPASDIPRTIGGGAAPASVTDAGSTSPNRTTIGAGNPAGDSTSGSSAQDAPNRTTIGPGDPETNVIPGYNGPNTSVVGSGPVITRITSEGGIVKTETIGRGPSGAGSSQGPNAAPSAARIKQEAAFIPDWANQPQASDGLAKFLVRPGASEKDQYDTLNEALEQAPASGAVIQLEGSGPFPLYPVKIDGKTRIVIEPRDPSDAANIPLIVLLPPEEGSASNFLEFSNTAVEFRQVHLGLDASSFSTDPDDAMLSAVSADVSLANCSLSVKGTSNSQMTALKIAGKSRRADGKSGAPCRVLIENTLIRGNNLTGLLVQTEHLDVAVRNSLIWSGGAPAVRFGSLSRSDADSGRNLRLASTTVCSRRCAVQMAGDAAQPVPTSFDLLNSLVAAPAGSTAPALFDREGWDQSQQKGAFGKFLTWKTADSVYAGWKTLVQLNPGPVASVTTPAQWQSAWKDKTAPDREQFQAAPWPAQPIADVAAANLDILAPQSMGKQVVKTADGGWPGCQTAALVTVDLTNLEAVKVAAVRAEIPPGLFNFAARETIRVDLTKEDLGKFLERQKLRNGTHIIAAGSGPRQSSPIVVENAWVRLSFEQTSGPPLVLSPRPAETKHDGFISVVNGGIEIVGAVFSVPASERQPLPRWFIQVVDGDLAMWRCRIHGPMIGTTRNKGLIQWQRSGGRAPARLFDGGYQGYAALVDCYLIGSGTTLEADMRHRALFLRNTIAVSRDGVLALSVRGEDSQIGGVVDMQYSTLSAVDRFIHVDGAELGAPTSSPLSFYADRCVFAPPLRSGQQRVAPTLLSYSGQALEQKQIAWWENRCGYAADIAGFLRPDSDPDAAAPQNFEQAWVGQWGPEQVVEPLLGVKGVLLKADLPTRPEDRVRIEPADFEL
ncbi:MAG: serine/threonine-protein kinase, partial [Deltaproteobacteria bacterium]